MEIEKSPKIPKKFYCEKCHYECSNKKDFGKHELTRKHLLEINDEVRKPKNPHCICHKCERQFQTKSGLWKHTKKCIIPDDEYEHQMISSNTIIQKENTVSGKKFDMVDMKDMFFKLMEQNQELQKQLIEMAKEGKTIYQNTTNYNNKFNIKVFLNEHCKDAINLPDFVNSIKLQLTDLEKVGQLGYAEGISRIFVKGLQQLDVYKRPIHCTDSKREKLFVRDKDVWEGDDEAKNKLKVAIRKVAHNNFKQISDWTAMNPDHKKGDTPEHNEWAQIVYNSNGGGKDEEHNYNKIIKNLAHASVINKDAITEN
jgi:hypothetical protein